MLNLKFIVVVGFIIVITYIHLATYFGGINTRVNISYLDLVSVDEYEKNECNIQPPIDSVIRKYDIFDSWFESIGFEFDATLEYIHTKSIYNCHSIQHGVLYEFENAKNGSNALNIAILSLFIPTSNMSIISKGATMDEYGMSIFNDIRTYYFKIANTLRYSELYGYSFIYLTEIMWKYTYNGNDELLKTEYMKYMNKSHWQKPFFIAKYLSQYDWILWMDFDTIFVNCYNEYNFRYSIENMILNHAYYLHQNEKYISIIFGGEYYSTINAGIFALKNNEWSKQFLSDWMYLHENVDKFEVLKVWNVLHDQTLFIALLQGFDIHSKTNATYKDIEYKRDLSRRGYIQSALEMNADELYLNPIFDPNISKYAVAVEQSFINGKLYNMVKGKYSPVLDIHNAYIIHFYSKDKTIQDSVFRIFNHSLQRCAYHK